MKIFISIMMAYFYFSALIPLFSQTREVSLEECILIALQNHSEIKSADEDRKMAIANYELAKSRDKLHVNLEFKTVESQKTDAELEGIIKDKGDLEFLPEDYQIGIYAGPTFQYRLYDPQSSEMMDSTRLAIDMSKIKLLKSKMNIIANVKIGYYGYLFARGNRELREQMVNKFKIKLKKAKRLFKNGQRPILDVTKSEVDLADAMLQYEKAKNHANKVKTVLLTAMGIMDDEIEFSPIKVHELPKLQLGLKELNRLAEDNYPDIKIAKLAKEINIINVSAAKSAHNLSVDLIGSLGFLNRNIIDNYSINMDNKSIDMSDNLKLNDENWEIMAQLGLQAKVPIYSGGAIEANVDSFIAEYNKSKYLERDLSIKLKAMIKNYYQSLNEYKKQIEISQLMIDNAKKHLMLAQKSYESGIGSQLDMQDAEMTVLKAKLSLLKARYDYLISLAKLSNVVGLGEEYLCLK